MTDTKTESPTDVRCRVWLAAPRGLKGLQYLAWCIGRDDAYLRNPPVRYRRFEKRYRAAYRKGYLAQKSANAQAEGAEASGRAS